MKALSIDQPYASLVAHYTGSAHPDPQRQTSAKHGPPATNTNPKSARVRYIAFALVSGVLVPQRLPKGVKLLKHCVVAICF